MPSNRRRKTMMEILMKAIDRAPELLDHPGTELNATAFIGRESFGWESDAIEGSWFKLVSILTRSKRM